MKQIDIRIDEHDMSILLNLLGSKLEELIINDDDDSILKQAVKEIHGKDTYKQMLLEHKNAFNKFNTIAKDFIQENPNCMLKEYVENLIYLENM